MRDFTLEMYRRLVEALKDRGYEFLTFEKFPGRRISPGGDPGALPGRMAVMRHDVDKKPGNALQTARIEGESGICATYYFRIVKESFDEGIIKEISGLGHEVGYHYEDLSRCRGDMEKAIENFASNLERLRALTPVKTICMHGSPTSLWDNRRLWEKYDYRDFDIIGEPYFDIDFSEVLYLTDTGRRWNGFDVSIRDRVDSAYKIDARTTPDLIGCLRRGEFPARIMLNVHPQRWDAALMPWVGQLIGQNLKNMVKRIIIKKGSG